MALTDAQIRALKPEAKPKKLADSAGLHVVVTPSGSKLWRYAYRFDGRQKLLSLGAYPIISLSEARKAHEAARRQLAAGEDPSETRKTEKRRRRLLSGDTFKAVADEWFENNRGRWVESYASRLRSRLNDDLIRKLGARLIAEIEPLEVLEVIRGVERRDALEMSRRVLQMASAVFRYGVATGRCARDVTADLRGALKAKGAVNHRSALSSSELPVFLKALAAYSGEAQTALGLQLALLTFVRTSELRFATWDEFEGLHEPEPLWRIPAGRMKMRRSHLVPLSAQSVGVLLQLKRLSGASAFILPARTRNGVISENTLLYALYRMGFHGRATVHGFRSTASTILNEHGFNSDWIEAQLAHSEGSVRSIYNAAEWLPGRRKMMQWWADYLERAASMQAEHPASSAAADLPAPALAAQQRWEAERSSPQPARPVQRSVTGRSHLRAVR